MGGVRGRGRGRGRVRRSLRNTEECEHRVRVRDRVGLEFPTDSQGFGQTILILAPLRMAFPSRSRCRDIAIKVES